MKIVSAHSKIVRFLMHNWCVAALILSAIFFIADQSLANQDEPSVLPALVINSKYFPCSTCHGQDVLMQKKSTQNVHQTILVKGHIEEEYDCFGCHDKKDMDKLTLFNGSTIDLVNASQLCGQCHSTSYKLWQSGLHGKVVGKWNGPKKITPCTTCHDPHQPVYKAQQPAPPPTAPDKTLRWNK